MAQIIPTKKTLAQAFLIFVLTLLSYTNAMQGGFVWDDEHLISAFHPNLGQDEGLKKSWLEPLAAPPYYPVVRTAFWIEYHLWGDQPWGYHVVNVLLHIVNALLVWMVLRQLNFTAAFWAAAVFALHPVHVESVAWISELKNVLSGMFYLSSLSFYLRFAGTRRDKVNSSPSGNASPGLSWGWYGLAFVFYLAALLSKTVTCSLPVVILLIIWHWRGALRKSDLYPLVPFLLSGFVLGLVTVWLEKHHVGAQGPMWDFTFVERVLIAGRAFWFYPGKLLWPAGLVFIYPRWEIDAGVGWQYVFPLLAVALIAALWFGRRRWGRGPLAGVLFYVITLFPAMGFFDIYPMKYSFVADHFQYLASLGWIVLFAAAMLRCLGDNRRLVGVGVIILIVLSHLTWLQGMNYKDLRTFYQHILSRNPRCDMARNNLGILYLRESRSEKAITEFQRVIEIQPDYIMAYLNLGIAYTEEGEQEKAIEAFGQGLRIQPNPYQDLFYHNLGVLYQKMKQVDKAAEAYRSALAINPGLEKSRQALSRLQEERL